MVACYDGRDCKSAALGTDAATIHTLETTDTGTLHNPVATQGVALAVGRMKESASEEGSSEGGVDIRPCQMLQFNSLVSDQLRKKLIHTS